MTERYRILTNHRKNSGTWWCSKSLSLNYETFALNYAFWNNWHLYWKKKRLSACMWFYVKRVSSHLANTTCCRVKVPIAHFICTMCQNRPQPILGITVRLIFGCLHSVNYRRDMKPKFSFIWIRYQLYAEKDQQLSGLSKKPCLRESPSGGGIVISAMF